jgi:hypothetical protein
VSSNKVLVSFLPYIEGILIDTPEAIEDLIDISEEPNKDFIACLVRIIHMTDKIYDSFTQDIAVRILVRVFSRFNTQHKFSGASSQLLETLIQTKDKSISDLVLMFAFSNLLLIPKKPIEFIEHGGLDMTREILERSENKIKTNYYGLLCYWILSYEEKFVSYAALPSVFLFFFYFLILKT